jgi:hypothetical protein
MNTSGDLFWLFFMEFCWNKQLWLRNHSNPRRSFDRNVRRQTGLRPLPPGHGRPHSPFAGRRQTSRRSFRCSQSSARR